MGDFRKKYPTREKKFLQGKYLPGAESNGRPFSPQANAFWVTWSERRRLPRIRHRGELTEKARKKALQCDQAKTLSVWNLVLFSKTSLRIHL